MTPARAPAPSFPGVAQAANAFPGKDPLKRPAKKTQSSFTKRFCDRKRFFGLGNKLTFKSKADINSYFSNNYITKTSWTWFTQASKSVPLCSGTPNSLKSLQGLKGKAKGQSEVFGGIFCSII